jgi:hypothetical protein
LEWNLLILGGLAGKLDLQISMDRGGCGCSFGQSGAHAHNGKLGAACRLQHVKIAVAVPRIKRLHGDSDQEIALSGVTNAFASRGMTDAVDLMQRVRDVIGEHGLFQNPLAIGLGKLGSQHKGQQHPVRFIHKSCSEFNSHGRDGQAERHVRNGGHRRMRLGDPMNPLPVVFLTEGHRPQNGG